MNTAPVSQLKAIYGTDDKLLYHMRNICFTAKVHFLKELFRDMGGHKVVTPPEITNNLFLLYCIFTNNNWVLNAYIDSKSEFIALLNMHKQHIIEWYYSCINYTLKEIHNDLEDIVKNGILAAYGPSTVKIINAEIQNILYTNTHYAKREFSNESIASIESIDLLLTHELFQIDKIGLDTYKVNRAASNFINRKAVYDLLRKIWIYTTSMNINTINSSDIYNALVLYSFISKLFTNSHFRTFTIPSSENTTYRQVLTSLMNELCKKIHKGTYHQSSLPEIFNKLKEYKHILATNKVLRSMTNYEAVVLGCSCHLPYINVVESKLEESNIIDSDTVFDIVMTKLTDFYMLFSLLYQDLKDNLSCNC